MNIKKNSTSMIVVALAAFAVLGWSLALDRSSTANAENSIPADDETIEALYEGVFGRPADAGGKQFYRGKTVNQILKDFANSDERRYYSALFKAVKSYEEAQRAPGTLTAEEKQSHLDLIDSAISNLLAWVGTLPDQDACRATVDSAKAREAIQTAYAKMNPQAREKAEHGIFNALKRIGRPETIVIHNKCVKPTATPRPSVSPTPTPTPSPTASPTPTPTATPTPTPVATASPTATPTPTPTPTQ